MQKQKNNAHQKKFIARLMAVQACYQMIQNKKPVRMVIQEFLEDGLKTDEEGEPEIANLDSAVILPNGGLFKKILLNLDERKAEIENIIDGQLPKINIIKEISEDPDATEEAIEPKSKEVEPLLKSILLCGVCEILVHTDTDTPLIVNDYLNVTHEFYAKQQVSFVNGILDSVAKLLR